LTTRPRRRQQQRVAIGRRTGHRLGADIAAAAAAIVDHHGLSPHFGQSVSQQARHHVVRSAGREGDHDLDAALGEFRVRRVPDQRAHHEGRESGNEVPHSILQIIDFSDFVDFKLTAMIAVVKSADVVPSDQSYRHVNEES
jgi:hypothetical protein